MSTIKPATTKTETHYNFPAVENAVNKLKAYLPQKDTVIKVGLAATGLLAVSFAGYTLYQYMQPTSLDPEELIPMLEEECKKAVHNFCIGNPDKTICLKDYLAPDWTPIVTIEYGADILCPVTLQHANCEAIVHQPTMSEWLAGGIRNRFQKNFEPITHNIASNVLNLFGDSLKSHQEGLNVASNQIQFKTHVFCEQLPPPPGIFSGILSLIRG